MHKETRKWILQADKDFGTAGFALNSIDGPLPVTTGLHCQRSVENYFKAYLHDREIPFSSQNNLNVLFEARISVDETFEILRKDINQLAGYSIASRYPEAKDSLKFREDAVAAATRVKEFVLGKLV